MSPTPIPADITIRNFFKNLRKTYAHMTFRIFENALLNVQNTILSSLNRNEVALLLLIDFPKVSDMVNHEI